MKTEDITIEGIALKIAPTPVIHMGVVERHFVESTTASSDGVKAIIGAAFHGIRRARKECEASGQITLEWLEENTDSVNLGALVSAFMKVNFPSTASGEGLGNPS